MILLILSENMLRASAHNRMCQLAPLAALTCGGWHGARANACIVCSGSEPEARAPETIAAKHKASYHSGMLSGRPNGLYHPHSEE